VCVRACVRVCVRVCVCVHRFASCGKSVGSLSGERSSSTCGGARPLVTSRTAPPLPLFEWRRERLGSRVPLCVCVWERETERDRERQRETERDRDRDRNRVRDRETERQRDRETEREVVLHLVLCL
jgi:hypothetical protein